MRHFGIHRPIRSQDGASLVETALTTMMMVVVLFSLFELFLAFYSTHYVSYAAREGARWAMVRGSKCSNSASDTTAMKCGAQGTDVTTYIQGLDFPGINASNVSVATSWLTATTTSTGNAAAPDKTSWGACAGSGCNIPGNAVQVQVTYAFPVNLVVYQTTLNLTSTSQMVISQ